MNKNSQKAIFSNSKIIKLLIILFATAINENIFSAEKILYHKNGVVKAKYEYIEGGKLHGGYTIYFENGKEKTIGQYENGKKTGLWKFYNENGELIKEEEMQKEEAESVLPATIEFKTKVKDYGNLTPAFLVQKRYYRLSSSKFKDYARVDYMARNLGSHLQDIPDVYSYIKAYRFLNILKINLLAGGLIIAAISLGAESEAGMSAGGLIAISFAIPHFINFATLPKAVKVYNSKIEKK